MVESTNSLSGSSRGTLALAGDALAFAVGFLVRNPGTILRRIAIPGALGCVALYVLVWGYCSQLTAYLAFPSEGLAGRVMGIAAASVLIMLLLHAIVASRVAGLVTGEKNVEPGFLGIRSDAWRIYAANLRLLLGLGLYGLAMFGASTLMVRFGIAPNIVTVFSATAWLLLCWSAARGWFFLVPICLQTSEENGLGVSWRRSKGYLPLIGLITLAILFVTAVLLAAGEFLMHATGLLSQPPVNPSFATAIGFYLRNLWPFVVMVSVVYLFSVTLMTAARIRIYQELSAASPA